MISKADRKVLQEKYGKGNYRVKWNHGGNTLFVKKLCVDGKKHFKMEAYDYESYIKTLR